MKKALSIIFMKILLFTPHSYAALIELDSSDNSSPNIIDQSYNNQTENILNAQGEYGEDAIEIIVNDGVEFNNNTSTSKEPLLSMSNSNIKFLGNNKFNNNNIVSPLFNSFSSSVYFGDNTEFSNNKTSYGFIAIHTPTSPAYFGNNISFTNNNVLYGGYGGIINVYYYFNDISFGNNLLFDNNTIKGVYGGGIIATTLSNANFAFGDNVVFSNNKIFTDGGISGGIIKVDNNSVFNFNGTTKFINNSITVEDLDEKYIYGNVVYLTNATMNFNLAEKGQYVLFQDNASYFNNPATGKLEKELNSFYLSDQGNVNFNLAKGTYADIRDPIKSESKFWAAPEINKTGEGSLYLWGDNSEYYSSLRIKEGSFYAMYDKDSPWDQRQNFNLNNATITFENGSLFRPMMNEEHNMLAQLIDNKSNLTVNGTVFLAPYELSKLDVGNYFFDNDYNEFSGWNSDLAELTVNGRENVELNIKNDLDGYKGLTSLADIYRKRSDLSLYEREILDNLYMTGELTDDLKDILGILEGSDVINFEQAHRGSIRQFNRQIYSRVNNRNCRECGVEKGYRDEHVWFNTGYNRIKKSGSSNSAGYTYNPTSFAIGYDFDLIPRKLNTGLALGHSRGQVKSSSGTVKSTNDMNEYLISVYSKYKPKKAFINASVGGGLITNDTKLISSTASTTGRYDSKVFFSNVDFGYDFGKYTETIEPYIGVDYTHIKANKLKERGVGARHFDEIEWNIVETPIGVRYSKDIYMDSNIITPAIDVAFAYNFGDTKAHTNAYFASNQNNKWKVVSSSEERESFRGNLNLKVNNLNMPFAFNFGYAVDLRSDYKDNQVYATIRYDF